MGKRSAERLERRATVALFVDISGFTALVETVDVEDAHDVVRSAFAEAAAVVTGCGGTVEKYVGDAVLALFGAQRSHRDDADRATEAAWIIRERLAAHAALTVRAGIEAGEVLVDRDRLQTSRDLMVLGDAVNTAARLQQLAAPGEVLVGPEASVLVTAQLGPPRRLALKGKQHTIVAAAVLKPPRRGMPHAGAPLLGRESELAVIEAALSDAARCEQVRVVAIVGAPGIGKSRLALEFAGGARSARWAACPQPEEGSTADVLRALLQPDAEGTANGAGDPVVSIASAHAARTIAGDDPRHLARLLSVSAGLAEAAVDEPLLVRSGRADELKVAWRAYLEGCTRATGSLVVVLDDAHWATPDLQELLAGAISRVRGALLLLLTAWDAAALRTWRGVLDLAVLNLEGLPRASAIELARGAGASSDRALEIVERAEGNPLYVETMSRHVREASASLPLGLRAAVTARLDSLPVNLRHAVAAAAVLGRRVEPRAVGALVGTKTAAARHACDALVGDAILAPAPQGGYAFRHQLLAATAYAELTRRDRRRFHDVAATWLLDLERAPAARRRAWVAGPSEIARHLVGAGRGLEAVPFFLDAGEQALRAYAAHEAADLIGQAMALVDDATERGQMLCKLGDAHHLAGEPRRAQQCLEEGLELAGAAMDPMEAAHFQLLLGRCLWLGGQVEAAGERYERARRSVESKGATEVLANAYVRLAELEILDESGDLALARELAERAIEIADDAGADAARILAYDRLGQTLVEQGDADAGIAYLDRSWQEALSHGLLFIASLALRNAMHTRFAVFRLLEIPPLLERLRELGLPQSELDIVSIEGVVAQEAGPLHDALSARDRAVQLCAQAGELLVERIEREAKAYVLLEMGRIEECRTWVSESLRSHAMLNETLLVDWSALQARLSLLSGDIGEATTFAVDFIRRQPRSAVHGYNVDVAVTALVAGGLLETARQLVAEVTAGKGWHARSPYVLRAQGRIALACGDEEAACGVWGRAIDTLSAAGYHIEALHTRVLLARGLTHLGATSEAEDLLQSIVVMADRLDAGLVVKLAQDLASESCLRVPEVS